MMKSLSSSLLSFIASGGLLLSPAFAQDRADIDRTQIIGNRELPKVLYIVPWKKPMAGDLVGRPLISVIDEALAPLDKDVFRRELEYDAALRSRLAAKPLTETSAHANAKGTGGSQEVAATPNPLQR